MVNYDGREGPLPPPPPPAGESQVPAQKPVFPAPAEKAKEPVAPKQPQQETVRQEPRPSFLNKPQAPRQVPFSPPPPGVNPPKSTASSPLAAPKHAAAEADPFELELAPEEPLSLEVARPPLRQAHQISPASQFPCPHCQTPIYDDGSMPGQLVLCPDCGGRLYMPGHAPAQAVVPAGAPAISHNRPGNISGIAVPVLISAVMNLIVGLAWISTCIGVVIGVPMIVLCCMEFSFHNRLQHMNRSQAGREAATLGVMEIIAGLFNFVSLVCGILVLINGSQYASDEN